MLRKIATILVWAMISVGLQAGFLYYLEKQIKGDPIAAAPQERKPIVIQKTIDIPQSGISGLEASFAKDYLAFTDGQGLKVYNVKTGKTAFVENKPVKGEILYYRWLPDRNTLLFLTSKPNPAPKPVAVPPKKVADEIHAGEDPASKTQPAPAPTPKYNPQVTELYAVDFADPDDADAVADKRLANKLDDFPAGASVEGMEFSTYTNLIYVQAKTPVGQTIYEIDVMKRIRTVNRQGEAISHMAASDKKGTLYVQSVLSGVSQIVAVKHNGREQLIKGKQYTLIGQADNKVYIGEIENDNLIKILSVADTGNQEKLSTKTEVEWSGKLPVGSKRIVADTGGFFLIYDVRGGVILDKGQERAVNFSGRQVYVTSDGREAMEVTSHKAGTTTVEFKPL